MCHAPVVIPPIGREQAAHCAASTRAMRAVAARAVAVGGDELVIVSPHAPPETHLVFDTLAHARAAPLDHGAQVPLWFLEEAGWRGPVRVLATPQGDASALLLGQRLHAEAAAHGQRRVLIASGDGSHALHPSAPCGFHTSALGFQQAFGEVVAAGDWQRLPTLPGRTDAAEDCVASVLVVAGACGLLHPEIWAHEAPFGVGYCTATLYDPSPPLDAWARAGIRAALDGRPRPRPVVGTPARALFVTLSRHGALRGCVGGLAAACETLEEEAALRGAAAACEDPRFPPLTAAELQDLTVEVTVLGPREPLSGGEEPDPAVWGRVVSGEVDGQARIGLLLPGLPSVTTAAQQDAICCEKAGLTPAQVQRRERFWVEKIQNR